MPNPIEDLPQVMMIEVRGGVPETLHARLAALPNFRGITQREGKTYACFKGEPPAPIRTQLHRIAGKP